jgi:hypothetical protein
MKKVLENMEQNKPGDLLSFGRLIFGGVERTKMICRALNDCKEINNTEKALKSLGE